MIPFLPARRQAGSGEIRKNGAKGLMVVLFLEPEEQVVEGQEQGQVYIDRTKSGAGGFSSSFPGVQTAALKATGGAVTLHVLVDWSSVEVFNDDGKIALTDQIFPARPARAWRPSPTKETLSSPPWTSSRCSPPGRPVVPSNRGLSTGQTAAPATSPLRAPRPLQHPFAKRELPALNQDRHNDDPADEPQDAKDFPCGRLDTLLLRFSGGDKGKQPEDDAKNE